MPPLLLNHEITERLVRALFEEAPEPMLFIDVLHRVREANASACSLLGTDRAALAGHALRDVLPPGVDAEQVHRALAGLTQTPAELTWCDGRGEPMHMAVEVRRLAPDGNLVVFRDASLERRMRERLRETKRMESFGYMASAVAHDLNNLLLPILCYAEQLQVEGTPASAAMLNDIRQAAERASILTRRLLSLLRDPAPVRNNVVRVGAVVDGVAGLIRGLVGDRVELVTRSGEDAVRVRVDRDRLERLLLNLAVNARDAMPHGGTLAIETSSVSLGEASIKAPVVARPGRYVMLSVSDTGIGMDEETRERIFEPFFTTKEPGSGTGLGLSTVMSFLRQSRGWIFVESEPGMGTSFKIYLPAAEGD